MVLSAPLVALTAGLHFKLYLSLAVSRFSFVTVLAALTHFAEVELMLLLSSQQWCLHCSAVRLL